jgi:surface polysaccharide O-acyltransferase-like enzyme
MGFFFFLSALFIGSSLERKGTKQFFIDRLKRLGLPLVFYSLILSPFISFLVERFGKGYDISIGQYISGYHHWIDFGVLWFVAALLLFTFIYVLINRLFHLLSKGSKPVPSNKKIFWFAVVLGILSYLVRIFFPVGWVLEPVGFQLAHFSQYIAMFVVGLAAARNQWLESVNIKKAKPFARLAAAFILIGFPMIYVVKQITASPIEAFLGGGTYQSLLSSLWEQITGISIMVALLGYGKELWNRQTAILKNMTRSAYAVYIFHPLVLVSLALLFSNLKIDPAIKLLFVAPLTVIFSFLLGGMLVNIPGVRNII